jgi:hypothetical protein
VSLPALIKQLPSVPRRESGGGLGP